MARHSNVICPRCDQWMYKEHGSVGVYYCLNCMLEITIDPITKAIISSNDDLVYDEIYEGEEEKEDVCVACGNPAYPECMDGCPLCDD